MLRLKVESEEEDEQLQSRGNQFPVAISHSEGIAFEKRWCDLTPANVRCREDSYFCESVRRLYAREIAAVKIIWRNG